MGLLIRATPLCLLLCQHLPALSQASRVQSRHRWPFSPAVMHLGRIKRREASSSKGKTSSKDLGPIRKTNKGFVYSIWAAHTAPETESSGEALCNKLIIFIGKKYVLIKTLEGVGAESPWERSVRCEGSAPGSSMSCSTQPLVHWVPVNILI